MNIATAFVEIRSKSDRGKAEVRNDAKAMAQEATKMFAEYFSAKMVVDEFSKVIKSAARLEQAVGGTEAIFGKFARTVDTAAKSSAKSMGLSEAAFREVTSQIGGLLNGLGFTQEEAANTSVSLAQLGADLAATFGGKPEEAVQALGAALRGEFDPLERFGVSLRQQQINLRAVEMGLAATTSTVDANARAQAALSLIMEQSTQAQGQFAREQDTASGKAATFSAELENMRAKLGAQLLPVFVMAVDLLSKLLDGFSALPGPVQVAVLALAAVVALAAPMMRMVAAVKALAIAIATANPYFLAAGAAIAILATVIVTLTGKVSASEKVIESMAEAMSSAETAAEGLATHLTTLATDFDSFARVYDKAGVTVQEVADAALEGGDAWTAMSAKLLAAGEAAGLTETEMTALRVQIAGLPTQASEAVAKMEQLDRITADTGETAGRAAYSVEDLGGEIEKTGEVAIDTSSKFDELDAAAGRLQSAFDDLIGRNIDASESFDAVFEAAFQTNETLKENKATLDVFTEAGRENRNIIREQASAILAYGTSLVKQGASSETATAKVLEMTEGLRQQMLQAGFTEEEVNAYLATLGLTPENVTTSLEVANVEAAKARVQELIDKVGDIPASKATHIQALIDGGKYAEAEAALNALARVREVTFRARMLAAKGDPTIPEGAAANGAFVQRPTVLLTGEAGNEAVLPLTRPSRLAQLLADPRIGNPVREALGGYGSAGANITAGATINVGSINTQQPAGVRDELEFLLWEMNAR